SSVKSLAQQGCTMRDLPESRLSPKVTSMKRGTMRTSGKYAAVAVLTSCLLMSSPPVHSAEDATPADTEHGRVIFENICSHCHHISFKDSAVGAPGLLDVMDRHDEAWVFTWLQSPAEFAKTDETAKALVESNPYGLTMPTIPEMQEAQNRRDVIAYLKTLKSK
ncbi:MAG: hypothetical protein CO017_04315, partial [Zetaproteobacteria bacterium CG_4_8_14_3_um_filter_59_5]